MRLPLRSPKGYPLNSRSPTFPSRPTSECQLPQEREERAAQPASLDGRRVFLQPRTSSSTTLGIFGIWCSSPFPPSVVQKGGGAATELKLSINYASNTQADRVHPPSKRE